MPSTQPSFLEPRIHEYVHGLVSGETDVMRKVRLVCEQEKLPAIAPETGRLLQVLVAAVDARRVVEVGCLHGYSALWFATATPTVRVETLEVDAGMARVARGNFEAEGVADRVNVVEGDARATLPALDGPVDLVFLDADKENLPAYVTEARRLLRPGGVLAIDNALWYGRVADEGHADAATEAIRAATRDVLGDPAFLGTLLPLGDGLVVAAKRR